MYLEVKKGERILTISEAALLQEDIAEEVAGLKQIAQSEAWEYRTHDPDAKWLPNFDLEANHKRVVELSKLHRRLGKAITKANMTTKFRGIAAIVCSS
jgi:hypothetical protein